MILYQVLDSMTKHNCICISRPYTNYAKSQEQVTYHYQFDFGLVNPSSCFVVYLCTDSNAFPWDVRTPVYVQCSRDWVTLTTAATHSLWICGLCGCLKQKYNMCHLQNKMAEPICTAYHFINVNFDAILETLLPLRFTVIYNWWSRY